MNLAIRSTLALAVCAALGTPAYALTQAEYASATKIYFGGASATDNTLEEVFLSTVGGICDATLGGIDIWRASNQRVITCKVSNDNTPGKGFATRAAGGTNIAFHKESQGGSSNGVVPLIAVAKSQAHTLRWLNVSAVNLATCTSVSVAATANLAGYTNHPSCDLQLTPVDTAASTTFDVHGGISDTEPALSSPKPGTSDIARLTSVPGIAIVFGVPVTKVLYRALQKAQFGNGSACDGSDLPTCVPSLTKTQVRAFYTQNVTDWNEIKNSAGTGLSATAGVTAPADTSVRICRRVASSGTQASFESYWLNQRCVSGVATFVEPDGDGSSIDDTTYVPSSFGAGFLVNAAPSSGNVRTCMQAANTGNFWGIGVLSTEVTASNLSGAGDSFRFVAIDGFAPTLANVANGDYDFFTENTINRVAPGNPGALAAGDVRREITTLVDEKLGLNSVLANLNATFAGRPWGNGGILSLSANSTTGTAPYTDAEMSSSPVNSLSRGGNNCTPPYMVKPTPTP